MSPETYKTDYRPEIKKNLLKCITSFVEEQWGPSDNGEGSSCEYVLNDEGATQAVMQMIEPLIAGIELQCRCHPNSVPCQACKLLQMVR